MYNLLELIITYVTLTKKVSAVFILFQNNFDGTEISEKQKGQAVNMNKEKANNLERNSMKCSIFVFTINWAGISGPLARGPYHKGPFLKDLWPKNLQNQRTFGQKDLCTSISYETVYCRPPLLSWSKMTTNTNLHSLMK